MAERDPEVADVWGRSALGKALLVLGALYLFGIWVDCIKEGLPMKVLPRQAAFFLQIAALFPRAATMAIDYRAEAWICSEKRWVEIDTRPTFPIDADDKENRFQRTMHFYREHRKTMQALERFVVESHNDGHADDGIPRDQKIGGARFLSLRIPFGNPGEKVERTKREPLATYPEEMRHNWYWTPKSKRQERCGGGPIEGADDADPSGKRGEPARRDGED